MCHNAISTSSPSPLTTATLTRQPSRFHRKCRDAAMHPAFQCAEHWKRDRFALSNWIHGNKSAALPIALWCKQPDTRANLW